MDKDYKSADGEGLTDIADKLDWQEQWASQAAKPFVSYKQAADEIRKLRGDPDVFLHKKDIALEHAEAILTYSPEISTNKGGKGPNTTTRLALELVREALGVDNGV